jgi:formate hydrogenlyase subunit 4
METLIFAPAILFLLLLMPSLMLGLIAKTKAFVSGRRGPPVFQPLHDILKLLGKGAVYSETSGWAFRLGPVLSLSAVLMAASLVPLFGAPLISFNGDAILFIYLLALGRFVTILAALDTGSSFEGMGASREAAFSSYAEPALILVFASLAIHSGSLSLSQMFSSGQGILPAPSVLLAASGLLIVLLAENSRIPVDDPNTHLELTMIHEVMVLDHSGPDLAFILYGAQLKLMLMGVLWIRLLSPSLASNAFLLTLSLCGLAIFIGAIESSMARLRLIRVPQLLIAAVCLAAFGLILAVR